MSTCRCCAKIGGSDPHTPLTCPFRRALYCFVCASHGHAPKSCPNQKAVACRRGEDPSKVENRELVVLHTSDAIRHVLMVNHITPLTTMEENKELLKDLANSLVEPLMIVYMK